MRVSVIDGVKSLVTQERPDPKPDGKQAIIKVEAVGLCGSDIHFWEAGDPVGLIMGHEFSGTIVDPGDRRDLKPGDRVTCLSYAPCLECPNCKEGNNYKCTNKGKSPGILHPDNVGAYAEYFVPAKNEYIYKLSDKVSLEEAAMCEPAAITKRGVEEVGGVKKGDTVVVAGGGIIGAMTIQWCKYYGAKYVALTETNPKRAELVMKMGYADDWFDAKDPEVAKKLMAKVPEGYDFFFDCTGNPAAINLGLSVIHLEGTEVWVGTTFEPVPINHLAAIFKQAVIKNTIGYSVHTFEECLKAVEDGTFPIKQYHTGSITFDEMQKSFETLFRPDNDQFKMILYPQK